MDQSIVIKAFNGDEEANTQLYNMTFKKVFAITSRIIRNYEDAMDLCQEAYLAALIHIDSLKDKSKFDVWLYQIAANRCKTYYQKEKRRRKALISTDEYYQYLEAANVDVSDPARSFNPEEYADMLDKKVVISHLIDELPANQKICILMHYYAELTVSEIATAMEIPEGTVKSNLKYAKDKLKRAILAHHKDYALKGTSGNSISMLVNSSVAEPTFSLPPARYMLVLREKAMNAQNKKES